MTYLTASLNIPPRLRLLPIPFFAAVVPRAKPFALTLVVAGIGAWPPIRLAAFLRSLDMCAEMHEAGMFGPKTIVSYAICNELLNADLSDHAA